ncbi:unnamed protein product [Caenorhabditis nigoni]
MRPARVRKQRFDLSQQQALQSSELDEHVRTAMVNNFPMHYYLGKELQDLEKLENCLRSALMKVTASFFNHSWKLMIQIIDYHAHPVGSSRSLSDKIRADVLDCADSGGNGTKSQQIILNCERMLASSCPNLNVWHLSFRIKKSKREIEVSKCNNQFNIVWIREAQETKTTLNFLEKIVKIIKINFIEMLKTDCRNARFATKERRNRQPSMLHSISTCATRRLCDIGFAIMKVWREHSVNTDGTWVSAFEWSEFYDLCDKS